MWWLKVKAVDFQYFVSPNECLWFDDVLLRDRIDSDTGVGANQDMEGQRSDMPNWTRNCAVGPNTKMILSIYEINYFPTWQWDVGLPAHIDNRTISLQYMSFIIRLFEGTDVYF